MTAVTQLIDFKVRLAYSITIGMIEKVGKDGLGLRREKKR